MNGVSFSFGQPSQRGSSSRRQASPAAASSFGFADLDDGFGAPQLPQQQQQAGSGFGFFAPMMAPPLAQGVGFALAPEHFAQQPVAFSFAAPPSSSSASASGSVLSIGLPQVVALAQQGQQDAAAAGFGGRNSPAAAVSSPALPAQHAAAASSAPRQPNQHHQDFQTFQDDLLQAVRSRTWDYFSQRVDPAVRAANERAEAAERRAAEAEARAEQLAEQLEDATTIPEETRVTELVRDAVGDMSVEQLKVLKRELLKSIELAKEEMRRRKRPAEGQDAHLCAICMDQPRSVLLLPCKHLVTCKSCMDRCQGKCPICREPIQDSITGVLPS